MNGYLSSMCYLAYTEQENFHIIQQKKKNPKLNYDMMENSIMMHLSCIYILQSAHSGLIQTKTILIETFFLILIYFNKTSGGKIVFYNRKCFASSKRDGKTIIIVVAVH